MKKILGLILLVISINMFSQNPANYQYRTVFERIRGTMQDSGFHFPRYSGIPSGVRTGVSTQAGAGAVDTINHGFYFYSGLKWRKAGTEAIKCGLTCNECAVVTWTGTGLHFYATAADYNLESVSYHFSGDSITLDAADGTFDRFDAIVLTSTGLSKITGSASSDPQLPQFNTCENVLLTYVFVQTGATTPSQVSDELIYDENVEPWTHTTSGTISANFASTVTALPGGTKSIAVASWSNGATINFAGPGTFDKNNYTTLSFWVKLTATMANNVNISVQFFNGATAVSNQAQASIVKNYTSSFQQAAFNISQMTFSSNTFTVIKIIFQGSNSNTVYLDWVRLQGGIIQPVSSPKDRFGLEDNIASQNRTFSGRNNTYGFTFDSINNLLVNRNGVVGRIYMNSTNSGMLSPDGTNGIEANDNELQLNAGTGANVFYTRTDSSYSKKKISYPGNIHGTFYPYSLVDKSYVDSVAGGGTSGIDDVLAQAQNLTAYRTINVNSNQLEISGGSPTDITMNVLGSSTVQLLNVINTGTGDGIWGQTSSSVNSGVHGLNDSYFGVTGENTNGGGGMLALTTGSTTNTALTALRISGRSSGTTAANFGVLMDMELERDNGSYVTGNQIISYWEDPTAGTETARYKITGVHGGALEAFMDIKYNGVVRVNNLADTLSTKAYARSVGGGGGGGYTNLTQFVAQNNWKTFYSDGSGDVQELSLGAAGSLFMSTGTAAAPAFTTDLLYNASALLLKETGGGQTMVQTGYTGLYFNPNSSNVQLTLENDNGVEGGFFTHVTGKMYFGTWSNHPLWFEVNNADAGLLNTDKEFIFHNSGTDAGDYKVQVGGNEYVSGDLRVVSRVLQTQGADVASTAGAMTLGTDGNSFEITGTNTITLISNVGWQNGAEVTLWFTSTAVLTDGTANSGTNIGMELNANTNFTGSAGASITLQLIEIGGTQRWREKCRSVN